MNTSHRYRPRIGLAAGAWVALLLAALMPLPSAMAADAAPPPAAASAPAAQSSAPASSAVTAPAPSATSSPAPATPAAVPADASAPVASPAGPPPAAAAPAAAPADSTRSLDEQVQDLKKSTLQLNRDLFILEEELLFPANTQVAVFVSVDVGDFFALDSINLKIDNREVSNYLYTPARGLGAAQGRRAAPLRRQSQVRRRTSWWRSSTARVRTIATTGAPRQFVSRRASAPNTSSSRSPIGRTRQQPEFEIKDWE